MDIPGLERGEGQVVAAHHEVAGDGSGDVDASRAGAVNVHNLARQQSWFGYVFLTFKLVLCDLFL